MLQEIYGVSIIFFCFGLFLLTCEVLYLVFKKLNC